MSPLWSRQSIRRAVLLVEDSDGIDGSLEVGESTDSPSQLSTSGIGRRIWDGEWGGGSRMNPESDPCEAEFATSDVLSTAHFRLLGTCIYSIVDAATWFIHDGIRSQVRRRVHHRRANTVKPALGRQIRPRSILRSEITERCHMMDSIHVQLDRDRGLTLWMQGRIVHASWRSKGDLDASFVHFIDDDPKAWSHCCRRLH